MLSLPQYRQSHKVVFYALMHILFLPFPLFSQTLNWPAESWSSAMNLTSKLTQTNVTELSGLHWNPATQCLYVVQDNGRLRILQFNEGVDDFFEIANVEIAGNPEGIMQVDYEASMFYTVDEKNYEIRQYVPNQDYTSITLMKKWRLLTPNTPMPDTGNDGIEGIVFVPDKHLQSIGFVSSQTGLPYTSTKGMGGLIFIAHQTEGYVWVYDVNPALSFDVAYVGKYKTNRKESCDIAFDRTTGLLYILHNVGKNFLEVTNLSLEQVNDEYKFVVSKEYSLSNPTDGNENIEGFAITPMCEENGVVSVFVCRDVNDTGTEIQKGDALRWFTDFPLLGSCPPITEDEQIQTDNARFTIEFTSLNGLYIHGAQENVELVFMDELGRIRYKTHYEPMSYLPYDVLPQGYSILQIHTSNDIQVVLIRL